MLIGGIAMYKKILNGFLVMQLILVFGLICVQGIEQSKWVSMPVSDYRPDQRILATDKLNGIGIASVAASGQRVVAVEELEQEVVEELDPESMELLWRIVEAEAGNQDEEGKLLVANVVLNRVGSEAFPNTVREVILQKENGVTQFSPVSNGTIWTVKVSKETEEAVGRALQGENISDGALYFVARKYADTGRMAWFDNHLTFLFEHGGHEFFK